MLRYISTIDWSLVGIFTEYIEHLRVIFSKLKNLGLKIKPKRCRFFLKVIPYLVYIIIQEVIKDDPEKLRGMMCIGRPNTKTELISLIVTVHYYHYMLPRMSPLLASPTEAYNIPKG